MTLLVATCTGSDHRHPVHLVGIHKIQHVIIIMQENRSFDSYFGTFPGANGIPMRHGMPTVCAPDPGTHRCVRPHHDSRDMDLAGPHQASNAVADIDGGKMDGFMRQARKGPIVCEIAPTNPLCLASRAHPDVMGYHDQREIPNYWTYAQNFVLQDHMFEPNLGWRLPSHLYLVSGWSASCTNPYRPMTCRADLIQAKEQLIGPPEPSSVPDYGWTDLTYLLHNHHVSWAYYLDQGYQPDCDDGAAVCSPKPQLIGVPEIWNPLPDFVTVHQDHQLGNIQPAARFFVAARTGTLPSVSWLIPNQAHSEHPPALVSAGQAWVTSAVDAVMSGPDWKSSAIFISWDDWGSFYDHVPPPRVGGLGYGLRVPGLVVSPYAKQGFIDHQVLSFDAYLKFIEDDFLGGRRLDPKTDGRRDPRPDVRENAGILGNLARDFDFSQSPRRPVLLKPWP